MLKGIALPILFLFLPIYFENITGIYIPFYCAIFLIFSYLFSYRYSKRLFYFTAAISVLSLLHIFFYKSQLNFNFFLLRVFAVLVFIWVCEIVKIGFLTSHLKYLKASFWFVFAYTIFAGFSFLGNYSFLLIPGTASQGNLTPLGILRCGTFGEGNYLGGYLALIALLFVKEPKMLIAAWIGCLIAYSPIPLILIPLLLFHVHFLSMKFRWATLKRMYIAVLFLVAVLAPFYIYNIISDSIDQYLNAESYNLKTSFVERTDFIVSGIKMWLKSPLIGQGFGQFSELLSDYATLPHLIINEENYRYIANNNFVEIASEQGVAGLCYYFMILWECENDFLRKRHFSASIFLFVLGIAMPTFFQIVVAGILGILRSIEYKKLMT